jgi:hypothetical protein
VGIQKSKDQETNKERVMHTTPTAEHVMRNSPLSRLWSGLVGRPFSSDHENTFLQIHKIQVTKQTLAFSLPKPPEFYMQNTMLK